MKYTQRKHRWPVALEGIVANLLFGALFTWSVYRIGLLEMFPAWTNGMLSAAFNLHNVSTCLGILFAGRASRKISKRILFLVFALCLLVGLGGIAFLPVSAPGFSFVMLVLLFSVTAAFGIGVGINVVQAATQAWFPDHTGLISGSLYMALGLSSFLLAALSRVTLPIMGLRASFGFVGVLVFVIAMLILCDRKALLDPEPASSHDAGEAVFSGGGQDSKQMLRNPTFWLLLVWNGCMRSAGFTLLDHAATIAVTFGAGALVGMLISPANGFGSLSFGALLDKLGLKGNLIVVCSAAICCAVCLIVGGRLELTALIIIGLMLGGMAYGGSSATYASSIRLVFGMKHFSSNFGFSNFSLVFGALIASFSGQILDYFGGDYNSIFVMIAIAIVPMALSTLALQFRLKK